MINEGLFDGQEEDEMEELPPLPPILVNPIGHCIICLRRVQEKEGFGSECGRDEEDGEDGPSESGTGAAAASKGRLPLPSGMITTLWAYLMGKERAAELEKVKFIISDDEGAAVTEVPPVCTLCGEELLELDRLHRALMKKIEDIKKIIKDTAGVGGVDNCGRREGFGELLRNSHYVEQGVIRNTFWFLERLSGTTAVEELILEGAASSSPIIFVQENEAEDEDPQPCNNVNVNGDWKLTAEALIPLTPVVLSFSGEKQTSQTEQRRGPARKAKVTSKDFESGLDLAFDEEPEIKKEVILEGEETADDNTDMLLDDNDAEMGMPDSSGADSDDDRASNIHPDCSSSVECKSEPDAEEDSPKPKRGGAVKRRRQKRMTPSKKKSRKDEPSWNKATCELCSERVSLPDLFQHMEAHVGGDFVIKCPNPQCSYAASNWKSLARNHLFRRRGTEACIAAWEEVGGQVCETCGVTDKKGQCFRAHLRLHETATKNIACPFPACEESFTVRQSVNVHISQKHLIVKSSGKCPLCRKLLDMKEMEAHLREQHQVEDVIKCRQCPFILPDWESYLDHAYRHRYDGVPCYICKDGESKKFLTTPDLRRHYLEEHQIGKRLVCEQCGMEFTMMDVLKAHVRHKHEGLSLKKKEKKSFKCDLCQDGTEFRREAVLISHKIREHGAEPFACPTCHQTFNSVQHLNRHELEAHAAEKGFQVKAKPTQFPCDVEGCTQILPSRKKFTFHKRKCHGILGPKAKPLVCEFCSKEFLRPRGLREHRNNIHLGAKKQHMCDTCGEDFTSIHNLNRHKMIHSGERPFSCHLCGQTFRQKGVMETHLKSHETLGDSFKPKGAMERRKRIKREQQCRRSKNLQT